MYEIISDIMSAETLLNGYLLLPFIMGMISLIVDTYFDDQKLSTDNKWQSLYAKTEHEVNL